MRPEVMRLGFIGGGVNSAVGTTHFIASQMDGRFEVVAGCFSRHADVNELTAERWNIAPERLHSSWQTMLAKERGKLDAVVVLTPTPDHTAPVVAALEAGHAVICEKSLAHCSADGVVMRDAMLANNGYLTVTYNYTGYPMVRELRALVETGKLGRITQIHVEMPQESFGRLNKEGSAPIPQQWRRHDARIPTIYLDLGSHLVHLVEFLIGQKPLQVAAQHNGQGLVPNVIDNVMCLARYSGNIDASIWFSKTALGHRNGQRVRIYGDKGAAEWHQMNPEFVVFNDNQGRRGIIDRANVDVQVANLDRYNRFKAGHPSGFLEAFANLYLDIADGLQDFRAGGAGEHPYTFSAQDGIDGLVMLEAMVDSAHDNRWHDVVLQR